MNAMTTPVRSALWTHCADIHDCTNCTTAGILGGCHWCPGGTCNAYGSVSGCLVGETCASPQDCIRSVAEFKGYEPPPAKAVAIFTVCSLAVMAMFICCLWGCFFAWDKRRRAALQARMAARHTQTEAANASTRGGMQLASMPVSASFRDERAGISTSPAPRATVTVTSVTKQRAGGELKESLLAGGQDSSDVETGAAGGRRYAVRVGQDGAAEVMLVDPDASHSLNASRGASSSVFPPPLPPLTQKEALLRRAAKCGLGMALVGTFVALLLACLLFPHMPEYSMCNRAIQWGSILQNMAAGSVSVDVDLHLSVWNPNRWHLQLKRIDARILYAQDVVGAGSAHDLQFDAGSIRDFLLTVAFSPSPLSAARMLRDHLRGELLLDVLFDLDTAVLLGNFARPLLQLNTSYVMHGVDAEAAAQRKLCKCQDEDAAQSAGMQTVMRHSMRVTTRIAPVDELQQQARIEPVRFGDDALLENTLVSHAALAPSAEGQQAEDTRAT